MSLEGIRNFRIIDERLATAGQPTEAELALVAGAGYRTVINLALPTSTFALPDEAAVARRVGLEYVPIPIDFENPDVPDALRLFEELLRRKNERVFVHCAMNMRVSALIYAYRVAVVGADPRVARRDLDAIWAPSEAWRRLMAEAARRSLPASIHLETPRLILREFEMSDLEACMAYASDPEVVTYMVWGPNDRDQTRHFLVRQSARPRDGDDRRSFELAIVLREQKALVGGVGLRVRDPMNREGDIGYVLNRRYWNQGIVTEAARAIAAFGFDVLGLHRIAATADVRNAASRRVMEKIGMRPEGVFREHVFLRGAWRDTAVSAMLEGDR